MYTTKQLFIEAVLAETNVSEILADNENQEIHGNWSKGYLVVRFTEPQGGENFRNVWYITNEVTGETSYQTSNTLDNSKNVDNQKLAVLTGYLKSNFLAYFINNVDITNNWAEATVFILTGETLTKGTALVYKPSGSPLTHKLVS